MNTPLQMASEDSPQAQHHDHVSQENMQQQIELPHAGQGQETSPMLLVSEEVHQPEVECGNPVDIQVGQDIIPGPVGELRRRQLLGRLFLMHYTMTFCNSGSGAHGNRAGASSSAHGVRHSSNSNISVVEVNPGIALAPPLQAPVQLIHHPVVEVPVEPPVVLFERGFLPNWADRMNLSNPGSLTIYPAVIE